MREESQSVLEDVISSIVIATITRPNIEMNMELSEKITEKLFGIKGIDPTHEFMDPRRFTVGEYCPKFIFKDETSNLNKKNVYVLLIPDPSEEPEGLIYRACMTAQAAKENNANKVILLATDFPHARQDRGTDEDKKAIGELNTVRLHARALEASGFDKIITTHEHSPRLSAIFALEYGLIPKEMLPISAQNKKYREIRFPDEFDPKNETYQKLGRKVFQSISPHSILADYLLHESSLVGSDYLKNNGEGIVLKSMDLGNRLFINLLQQSLFLENASVLYCNKTRKKKNDDKTVEVSIAKTSENFTTLNKKKEIFADDGLDTGGTMMSAVEWSNKGNICTDTGREYGYPAGRLVYFSHSWLGGASYRLIQKTINEKLLAEEFITTNSRPYIGGESQYYKFKKTLTVLRLAELWADAIIANEIGYNLMDRYTKFESEKEQHEFLKHLYVLKRHSAHFMNNKQPSDKKEIRFYLREEKK